MMGNRTLALLAVALVVLVGAATAPSWWPSSDEDRAPAGTSKVDPLGLAAIDADDVERIEVSRSGSDTIAITRDGGDWKVAKDDVDRAKVTALLDVLGDAADERAQLVSRTPGRHAGLGLAADGGTTVTIGLADGGDVSFIVGHGGDRAGTWYGRLVKDDRAWLLDGDIHAGLPADAASWKATPKDDDAPAAKGGAAKQGTTKAA